MNRPFRTVSALLRHDWLIDESYAAQHLELVNAFLSGRFQGSMFDDDDDDQKPIGFALIPPTGPKGGVSAQGDYHRLDISLSNPDVPAGSVGVIDVRGPIMKEGFCGSYGTEDYTAELNALYANDSFVGGVILVDSGGGQLSGTPTFYDAIRNPVKPTVVLVNDGMMASAAYWLACGADYIMASQPTDQIGSIGVFCRLRDNSKLLKDNGIKEFSIYSRRSKDKNRPVRDALAGKPGLLEDELDAAVAHFETAVRQGRGDRLTTRLDEEEDEEPFTGKLYYADEALKLGLIDGLGELNAAVAKVVELSGTSAKSGRQSRRSEAPAAVPQAPQTPPVAGTQNPALQANTQPDAQPVADDQSTDNPTNQSTDMFGNKHPKLTALAGLDASAITDDMLKEVNDELDSRTIKGVRIITTAYAQEAEESIGKLTTANTTIATQNEKIGELEKEVARLGEQPGHLGSKSPKQVEKTTDAPAENQFFTETDAELARMKGQQPK